MTVQHIEILKTGVCVLDLEIPRTDVADYLRMIPVDERDLAFIQAVEVGVLCLQRARASQEMDFVKRQVESFLTSVEASAEAIPRKVERAFVERIGTGDGQVLAPMRTLINEVSTAIADRLRDVRDLLTQEIDPAKDSSALGKALRQVRDLLEPSRNDSVQARLETALRAVTAQDGLLANTVRTVVVEAVTPLANEVNRLDKELGRREAVAGVLAETIDKGSSYEEEVVENLQPWSMVTGAEVHHVGNDKRPGDILIKLFPNATLPITLVIEARDRDSEPSGRKAVSSMLAIAMAERKANAAIFLSRSREGLAKEIGEWAEGECEQGPWVATTQAHLVTAVRFLTVRQQLAAMRESRPAADAAAVEAQLGRIRTTLARIATINHKVTNVRRSAEEIQSEAEALRDEVRSAISTIEDALRAPSMERSTA